MAVQTDLIYEIEGNKGDMRVQQFTKTANARWADGYFIEHLFGGAATGDRRAHPKAPAGLGMRWGFNWLPGQPRHARVDAEEGIDLDGILAKTRARASS